MALLNLILGFNLLLYLGPTATQQKRETNAPLSYHSTEILTNCENSIAILNAANQDAGAGLLIVIARLGAGENRRDINHRRLHNVRTYLSEYLHDGHGRRNRETIVLVEGERVRGPGRLELYVNGKQFEVLKLGRNADLIVGNCAPQPEDEICPPETRNLYPCRTKYIKTPSPVKRSRGCGV